MNDITPASFSSPPPRGATSEATMAAFLSLAEADPAVVGLVLSGSQAHDGMTTGHSDHDVHVITRDQGPSAVRELHGFRSEPLDKKRNGRLQVFSCQSSGQVSVAPSHRDRTKTVCRARADRCYRSEGRAERTRRWYP
ncbi:hypothetical protein ACWC9S_20980 [Streptomyces xiamenensis]